MRKPPRFTKRNEVVTSYYYYSGLTTYCFFIRKLHQQVKEAIKIYYNLENAFLIILAIKMRRSLRNCI